MSIGNAIHVQIDSLVTRRFRLNSYIVSEVIDKIRLTLLIHLGNLCWVSQDLSVKSMMTT